ncbi:MAG: hypothetical protein H6710_01465 [Myxococcales bacterium]|nr:hypothetical protein [Myxococcales bacterium]
MPSASAPLRVLALLSLVAACSGGEDTSAATAATATTTSGADSEGGTATDTGGALAPTWYQDVAPLVTARCGSCHVDGGIAPFELSTYESAKAWAPLVADTVEDGTMPPFLADDTEECQPRFGWKDDLRLNEDEKALLRAWADAGAPEGDPTMATPLPEPPSLVLDDADVRLTIPSPSTIDGKNDSFVCYSVDPGNATLDQWLSGFQINAGNSKIVHHVVIYIDEEGASADIADQDGKFDCFGGAGVDAPTSLMGAWAPGMAAFRAPPDVAFRIPAGGRLIFNMHYHPTGAGPEVDDSTSIDLKYFDGLPTYVGLLSFAGNDGKHRADGSGLQPGPNDGGGDPIFKIPAGVADHRESMIIKIGQGYPDVRVFAAGTHMHYVGTAMKVSLKRGNPLPGEPAEECLVETPTWDFGWQRAYQYDAPLDEVPVARAGDEVHVRCDYNNSMSNPFVLRALQEQGLDAPVDVYLGEETLDEMCLGIFGIAIKLSDLL